MTKLVKLVYLLIFCLNLNSQNPSTDLFYDLVLQNSLSNNDSVISISKQYLKTDNNNSTVFYLLAKSQFLKNDLNNAYINIDKALKLSNNIFYKLLKLDILLALSDFTSVNNLSIDIINSSKNEEVILNTLYKVSFIPNNKVYYKTIEQYLYKFHFNQEIFDIAINYFQNSFDINNFTTFSQLIFSNTYNDFTELYNLLDIALKKYNSQFLLKLVNHQTQNPQLNLLYSNFYLVNSKYDSAYFYFDKYLRNSNDYEQIKFYYNQNYKYFVSITNTYIDSFIVSFEKININYSFSDVLAVLYHTKNDFYRSLYHYNQSFSIENKNIDFTINYLNLLFRFDQFNKIDSLTTVLITYYPLDPYILLFKTIASIFNNKYDDAEFYLSRIKLISYDDNILLAYYYFYTAILYYKQQNLNQFNENLQKSLDIAQNNYTLSLNIAFYLSKYTTAYQKSLEILKKLEYPSNSSNLYIFSFVYYKNNDYNNALIFINNAIEKSIFPNFLHYELQGNIFAKLNNTKNANEAWSYSQKLGNRNVNKNL